MNMRPWFALPASTLAFTLLLSGGAATAAPAQAEPMSASTADVNATAEEEPALAAEAKRLEAVLAVYDRMPREVAESDEATIQAYLKANLPPSESDSISAAGWGKKAMCAAAITAALSSAAVPAAKILKLRAFIRKVGSVKEAAYLLIRVSTGAEKLENLGAVLGSLAAEVLGITAIKRYCS